MRWLCGLFFIVVSLNAYPLENFSWNFGKVNAEKLLIHNFKLFNDSNKVLEIKDVFTSCSCITCKIKGPSKLLPDETVNVEVNFDAKGYSGEITQYAYLHTNNSEQKVLKLEVKANVE